MDSVQASLQKVKDSVVGSTQSGTEPISGVKGAGTIDQPYDQGNAQENPAVSGTEPPSGITGAGRIDEPYDQGNAPEQAKVAAASTEPLSGVEGKGTVDEPHDQGNAEEQATVTSVAPGTEPPSGQQGRGTAEEPYDKGNQPEQPTSRGIPIPLTQPGPDDPLASPSTTHQGSGNPQMEPTKEQSQVISETRGRDEQSQHTTNTPATSNQKSTGTAANGGDFDASKPGAGQEASRLRYEERDVSPGEMRDGSHAVTSGDRGESYTPGKLNKLKDKLKIGRH